MYKVRLIRSLVDVFSVPLLVVLDGARAVSKI